MKKFPSALKIPITIALNSLSFIELPTKLRIKENDASNISGKNKSTNFFETFLSFSFTTPPKHTYYFPKL